MRGGEPTLRSGRNGALDAVRGIAILLVMAGHAGFPGAPFASAVGVTLFLLMSGFLITTLLADERARTGRIDLRRFIVRRSLRILPAALVAIAAWTAYAKWQTVGHPSRDALVTLFDVSNFVRAGGTELGPFSHMWTLSMQEQFYLVWPLALLAAWRLGRHAPVAIALIVASASALDRFVLTSALGPGPRIEFGPDTRIDALLFGSAVALLVGRQLIFRLERWWPSIAAVSLIAILALTTGSWGSAALSFEVGIPAAELFGIGLLLAAVAYGDRLWLSLKPLIAIGRVSYGLYLWHFPIMLAVQPRLWWLNIWLSIAVVFALSFAAAWLSWRVVEMPFMRVRSRIAPRVAVAAPRDSSALAVS